MMSFYVYLKIGSSRIRIKNPTHILTSTPIFLKILSPSKIGPAGSDFGNSACCPPLEQKLQGEDGLV